MSWLDVVIVAVFAWFTLTSLRTGMIREGVNLAAMVLATVLAGFFYDELARDVDLFTDDPVASRFVAFMMIFAAVVVAGHLVGVILKHTAQVLTFGAADHALGALFGFLKAFVLVEIFLVVAVTYPSLGLTDALNNSLLAGFFVENLSAIKALLPGEFSDGVALFRESGV